MILGIQNNWMDNIRLKILTLTESAAHSNQSCHILGLIQPDDFEEGHLGHFEVAYILQENPPFELDRADGALLEHAGAWWSPAVYS